MSDLVRLNSLCKAFVRRNSALVEKKKEIKTLSQPIKEDKEAILELMNSNRIPSCSSGGFVFTVKSSIKKPTLTTKVLLQLVHEQFGEDQYQLLQQRIARFRDQNSTTVHTLTTKEMKEGGGGGGGAAAAAVEDDNDEGDDEGDDTVDDLFP
jgi:hypothetical protein